MSSVTDTAARSRIMNKLSKRGISRDVYPPNLLSKTMLSSPANYTG